jgi:inorganic pyrophosphatase
MTENQIELPTNKLLEAHEEIVVAIAKQIEKVSSGSDLEDSCDIVFDQLRHDVEDYFDLEPDLLGQH